jgi:hypothetical protein
MFDNEAVRGVRRSDFTTSMTSVVAAAAANGDAIPLQNSLILEGFWDLHQQTF